MRYEFDSYAIDTERAELSNNAELIDIEPQVFDLLVYLMRNNDRVVSKDELFDTIWQGRAVSLSTLTTRINAARTATGDSGAEQKIIKTINRKGYRFVGDIKQPTSPAITLTNGAVTPKPIEHVQEYGQGEIEFCTSGNNVRIAYSRSGNGPAIVRVGNWFSHLEYDWDSPVYGYMLKWFASSHELVRYDMRGVGLSDHDIQEFSIEALVRDLEAVVDAAGLKQFILFGTSDGAAISIAYATRNPERVSKIVILGGYAKGSKVRGNDIDHARADATAIMLGPGAGPHNPILQTMLSAQFLPDGNEEQVNWLQDISIKSSSSMNAIRKLGVTNYIDILDLLPQVVTPTLIMHCRNDSLHPLEQGRMLAAHIPNAKFITLEGNNHALLEQDSDWPKFKREFSSFVSA